jgi:hypothetical protein
MLLCLVMFLCVCSLCVAENGKLLQVGSDGEAWHCGLGRNDVYRPKLKIRKSLSSSV